jgi:hypothetical protein
MPKLRAAFLAAVLAISAVDSLAVDSRSNREKIIAPRAKRFYKSNAIRKYVAFGGNHQSDQSSKSNEVNARFFYQSARLINEFNFLNEVTYSNLGSTAGKKHLVKKSELYDTSLSSKAIIGASKNYGVFYHRTIYDDMSKFYYDMQTAVGVGRIFFGEKLEFDTSIGYHDSKAYGQEMNIVPSMRLNLRLSERLTLNQRGYLFIDHESMDNELRTSLIYRIGSKVSLELRHSFEQRSYENDVNRQKTNEVNKSITFGLVFDLG